MTWKAERVGVMTITKKLTTFEDDDYKRSSLFRGKNSMTPSVTTPGDTNFSEATGFQKSFYCCKFGAKFNSRFVNYWRVC